ncbi:MAG: hypothetical protein WC310_03590 [Patescibacteria group bacterium]|jgi:hypothetical protein
MFDDLKNNQQPNSNQPVKEPEDIFSGVDSSVSPQVKRPVSPIMSNMEAMPDPSANSMMPSTEIPIAPNLKMKKIIVILIVVLAIVFVVLAGWLVYAKYFSANQSSLGENNLNNVLPELNLNQEDANLNEENKNINQGTGLIDQVNQSQNISQPTKDSDSDGLTDQEEVTLGTDSFLADSDLDGLFDKEEVYIYKTDPLNSDTDGDGYKDGQEVKGGYDPNGPGRLFSIPE